MQKDGRQRQRAGAGPASASTPAFLPSSSRKGIMGGVGSSSSGLSLSSFASALNLAGNGGGGGGNSSSLAATPTAAANNANNSGGGCGNDPSTHAGGATRGETLATCSGNWLSHLDWDGRRAWTLAEEVAATWEPLTTTASASPSKAQTTLPLPSDAGNRSDLRALAAAFDAVGDGGITADPAGVSAAQRAKEVLEVAQRADAKLRKEGRALAAAAAAAAAK